MNGERGDIAIDEVTFTRNQNCSFTPDFARSTYTAGKKNTIFREESTSTLVGLHAGSLSWSNWNLEMLIFDEGGKQDQRTRSKSLRQQPRTNSQTQPT